MRSALVFSLLAGSGFAAAPGGRYLLDFATADPEEFAGISGQVFGPIEVAVLLRPVGFPAGEAGIQGWSVGVRHDPLLELTQVTIDGTSAGALFDARTGFFHYAEVEPEKNGGKEGYVAATVLSLERPVALPTDRIGTLVTGIYRGVHPWVPEFTVTTLTFQYADGLVGDSGPVVNTLSAGDKSYLPEFLPLTRRLKTTPSCNVGLALAASTPGAEFDAGERRLKLDLPAGQDLVLDVTVGLAVSLRGEQGPEAWSISVKHDRQFFELLDASTDGADFLVHADPDPLQRFIRTEIVAGDSGTGFISAVLLSTAELRALPPAGAFSIARARYRLAAPHDEPATLPRTTIRFEDGLKGAGPPLENILTVDGKSEKACALEPLAVEVKVVRGGKVYLRGDPSNDGTPNITDAVWMVRRLFFDGPAAVCTAAADANGDLRFDTSDVIFLLTHLFQRGSAPPAPYPRCAPDPLLENPLGCDEDGVRCR